MTKLIIMLILIGATLFAGWKESQESHTGYIQLPGGWGFLCMGLALSTIIVLLVFGILFITT